MALLVAACQAPPVPSRAETPSPPPPARTEASVTVSGQILHPRGSPLAHAEVVVKAADANCQVMGDAVGALSDERGEYLVVLEGDPHCVVVEARSGGTTGNASMHVTSAQESPRVRIDVRLDRGAALTAAEAERLAKLLGNAINVPTADTAELRLYILHGPEALRVALAHYRVVLERVASVRALPVQPHDPRRFPFELRGSSGRTAQVDVYQEDLIRLHSALLDYGFRSEAFMNRYLRAIAANDPVRLSQVLNPDDIDFPVERAREIIADCQRRYRDPSAIRAEFVEVDERRHIITWRLRGIAPGGEEVTERIELGFGDGLIGMRNL